jgi:WhiB family redox-sensing transcriptional regulator
MSGDWEDYAACKGEIDLFFAPDSEDGRPGETKRQREDREARAKLICAQCPSRIECLAEADDDDFGIRGGMTPKERQAGRVLSPTPPKPPRWPRRVRKDVAECGTYSGRNTHLRLGERPCPPCHEAYLEYQRVYRLRTRRGVA